MVGMDPFAGVDVAMEGGTSQSPAAAAQTAPHGARRLL